MAPSTAAGMSDYEHAAWQTLLDEADPRRRRPGRFAAWRDRVTGGVGDAAARARAAAGHLPGADAALDAADATLTAAMDGLHTVFVERGLNSVTPAGVFAIFAEDGVDVHSYDEIRRLDLRHCDRSVPGRKERYVALAVTEGAASSLAVSGALLTTAVSGGAAVAVALSALAADLTTVLVGMGRIVAVVAAHYGYDVREPGEQIFASGVIAYAAADSAAEETAALASLSRLTGKMTARATWRHLRQQQTVAVMHRMFATLGVNLTKRKLAQAVPVLGAVVNGGLNARIATRTFERAQRAYRLRFLTEKHRLDPACWAPDVADGTVVALPMVDAVVDEELAPED